MLADAGACIATDASDAGERHETSLDAWRSPEREGAEMLVVAPLLCLPLIALALRTWRGAMGWRETLLAASALWGAYLTAVCELLSAAHALTAQWLTAAWAPLLLALWGYLIWWAWRNDWQAPTLTRESVRRMWRRLPWSLWAALGIVGVILSLTFVTALAAPPNTPDTVTYHLARVMHWIQNASLTPFPAHQISQDFQPPWAEYALLNLHLLSASDQLDGLLQWGCFVGCVVGVSLVAARLGAGARGQVFAALFAATIPMAVIQAASVQNDLVLAYWLVCLVYFLLAYRVASDSHARIRAALLAGLSLGLATLTKGVAYVDAAPFLLIFALWAMHAQRWQVWRLFVALTLLFLALNVGYFARNVSAFDSPLGAKETTSAYVNASFTPDVLALNVVRNLAVEFGGPNLKVNARVTHGAIRLLKWMGLDANDPRATMLRSPVFEARGDGGLWLSDAYTTNPIHLLFALMALVVCLALPALRSRHALLGYLLALVGAFLLFSLYLRWQAGGNRLLLGLFVLAAPPVGVALEALAQRLRPLGRFPSATHMSLLLATLLMSAAPRLLFAQSRPLLGPGSVLTTPRVDQYFAAFPPAKSVYVDGVDIIKVSGCHAIGFLVSGPQDRAGYATGAPAWEYQLWPLLGEPGGGSYRIEDVLVTNQTARLADAQPYASFRPCAVFAILQPPAIKRTLTVSGRNFQLIWHAQINYNASIVVYLPAAPASATISRHDTGLLGRAPPHYAF